MIDLVEEAEINRSTFYLHYRSLNDFVIEFENKLYNEFRKEIIQYFDTETVWFEQIISPKQDQKYSIIELILEMIENNPIIQSFIESKRYNSEFLSKIVSEGFEAAYDVIKQSEHTIDIDTFRYHYSFVAMGIVGLIVNWIQTGMTETTQQISSMAHKLVYLALSSSFQS